MSKYSFEFEVIKRSIAIYRMPEKEREAELAEMLQVLDQADQTTDVDELEQLLSQWHGEAYLPRPTCPMSELFDRTDEYRPPCLPMPLLLADWQFADTKEPEPDQLAVYALHRACRTECRWAMLRLKRDFDIMEYRYLRLIEKMDEAIPRPHFLAGSDALLKEFYRPRMVNLYLGIRSLLTDEPLPRSVRLDILGKDLYHPTLQAERVHSLIGCAKRAEALLADWQPADAAAGKQPLEILKRLDGLRREVPHPPLPYTEQLQGRLSDAIFLQQSGAACVNPNDEERVERWTKAHLQSLKDDIRQFDSVMSIKEYLQEKRGELAELLAASPHCTIVRRVCDELDAQYELCKSHPSDIIYRDSKKGKPQKEKPMLTDGAYQNCVAELITLVFGHTNDSNLLRVQTLKFIKTSKYTAKQQLSFPEVDKDIRRAVFYVLFRRGKNTEQWSKKKEEYAGFQKAVFKEEVDTQETILSKMDRGLKELQQMVDESKNRELIDFCNNL
ncbi:MAG: hypothetical protein ACI37U_01105 [Bacteroides sp.]